jgi:hypothetical protein
MNQFGIMVGLGKDGAFEGWFCKIDDKKNGLMFSVIWGYTTHEKTRHAFIQFQDNLHSSTSYISYPIDELKWTADPFILQIGKNKLSQTAMVLDFEKSGIQIRGDFHFGEFTPIKKSFLKPNIMGWLTYFPNECNHSIISMDHKVDGHFRIGSQSWNISSADGYIEKDWGTGFPKEYVWVQANDWENSSFVFSYATVPILGKHAKGFFLVFYHEGTEYRFTSIEGYKIIDYHVTKDSFEATVKKGGYRLTLKAKQSNPLALVSPYQGEMSTYQRIH